MIVHAFLSWTKKSGWPRFSYLNKDLPHSWFFCLLSSREL